MKGEQKKRWAFSLFLQGEPLDSIQATVGIGSDNTLRKWVQDGKWEELRAAKLLTRDQLVNSLLTAAKEIIDKAQKEGNLAQVADSLVKITASIEKLEPNSVVDSIGVFSVFSRWLLQRRATDKEVTMEFIKKVNQYQNAFIQEKL